MRLRGIAHRRALFGAGIALATAGILLGLSPIERASASGEDRTLSIFNIHTKETVTVTYKKDGKFIEDALKQLNHVMRDWRRDESREMDRELIDLIWTIHRQLGSQKPIHLISGYRSLNTNNKLRRTRGGQAKKSQHILGKAADIHFPDVPIKTLRNSALVQETGGVGYYPTSGIPFVHVDVGNVRMWPRIPRLELAALFPNGRTKYLPSDGKPITPRDYQLAAAKGLTKPQTMLAVATPDRNPVAQPAVLTGPQPTLPQVASYAPAGLAPEQAGASGTMAAPVVTDLPDPAKARPMLASYSPQPVASDATPGQMRFAFASAAGGMPTASTSFPSSGFPLYQSADVVSAPEADDDHPDELSYVPFEIASLMSDDSVARSREAADLSPPEQNDTAYLFEDMDRPVAASFRPRSSFNGLAMAQRFSGEAIRNLYAEIGPKGPTTLAQR